MAMGKRRTDRQGELWIAATEMPSTRAHPFYRKLNEVLNDHGFDSFAEGRCQRFYAEKMGRSSLPSAVYFRTLLIGYFEGIDSERGIAWRLADSWSFWQGTTVLSAKCRRVGRIAQPFVRRHDGRRKSDFYHGLLEARVVNTIVPLYIQKLADLVVGQSLNVADVPG